MPSRPEKYCVFNPNTSDVTQTFLFNRTLEAVQHITSRVTRGWGGWWFKFQLQALKAQYCGYRFMMQHKVPSYPQELNMKKSSPNHPACIIRLVNDDEAFWRCVGVCVCSVRARCVINSDMAKAKRPQLLRPTVLPSQRFTPFFTSAVKCFRGKKQNQSWHSDYSLKV